MACMVVTALRQPIGLPGTACVVVHHCPQHSHVGSGLRKRTDLLFGAARDSKEDIEVAEAANAARLRCVAG